MFGFARIALVAGLAATGLAGGASAQDYPSKPITLLVGFGAGGMTDVSARMLGEAMGKQLDAQIVVENRPGGGGMLSLNEMIRADHDGYTMVAMVSDTVFSTAYQGRLLAIDDYAMLGGYMTQERVLFAAADAPFAKMDEFIAYAKDNPVTFADGGSFASSRVMEAFARKNGMQLRMAPFKSGAEASAALMGGHVMTAETGVGTPAWFDARKSGNVKVLATLSTGGLAEFGLPEVEKMTEHGSEFSVATSYGLAVPADVPADVMEKLTAAFEAAVNDPSVQEHFKSIDLPLTYVDPQTFKTNVAETSSVANALKAYLAE